MNKDVIEAVRLGQQLCLRCRNSHQQECLELAVDELLRHPENVGPPKSLLRKALAHSRSRLRRRRAIQHLVSASDQLDTLDVGGGERMDAELHAMIEFDDWIRRSTLREEQKALLLYQVHDIDAGSIADHMSLPVPRVRERLARARFAARTERGRA
ncbi:hypothetical protein [Streptomyces olivaceoviridis]